jgi:prephenate dehydrogenase
MQRIHKLALIGVGLLGGSLGIAAQQRGLAARVEGFVRRKASVSECVEFGAVHAASTDLAAVVRDADVVVLCTPVAQMASLVELMGPSLQRGALVTDVGSVKGCVVAGLEPLAAAAGAHFVGSHPMAGAEKTGVKAARADLFEGAVCVLTPTARTKADALRRVTDFWKGVGARVLRLAPEMHDDLVGRGSHLPHIVAAELSNYVLSPANPAEQARLCANGFRDTTRIASGSPEMWRDIAIANRGNLARILGVFIEDLQEFQHALEKGDTATIEDFFVKAKQRRDAWTGNGASSPE